MKPLYAMKLIQIEVTNACHKKCANCTRFVGHHRKPFFMTLEMVSQALESLEGYPGNIGLMGGEPTLHPKFREICNLYRQLIPDRRRRELWTAGHKWTEYKDVILETFDQDLIAFNDHSSLDGVHQPLLVASSDIIEDKDLMWSLIDDCWVQNRWSASITPKGAFFCEVAAAQDHLFEGPGGYKVEKGWWNKKPDEFADQVRRYCPNCSGAVPLPKTSDRESHDLVSKTILNLLLKVKSPKAESGKIRLHEHIYSLAEILEAKEGWQPQNYRSFVAHSPEDYLSSTNDNRP